MNASVLGDLCCANMDRDASIKRCIKSDVRSNHMYTRRVKRLEEKLTYATLTPP